MDIAEVFGPYEKEVETALSRVFLYPQKAYKIYKSEEGFAGDFTDKEFRKAFYKEDFSWNRDMSPTIYLSLVGFSKNKDGRWALCDLGEADEFAIEMKRVDTNNTLNNYLLAGKATDDTIRAVADTMMQRLIKLTAEKRDSIPAFRQTWKELFKLRFKDARDFGYLAVDKGLSKARTDMVIDAAMTVLEDPYVTNYDESRYIVVIDNHADNILVTDQGIEFMDVYQFKPHWLAIDPLAAIARPAIDILALGGEEKGRIFLDQASKYYLLPSKKIVAQYLIYSASINGVFYFLIGKPEIAKKYQDQIDRLLKEIS